MPLFEWKKEHSVGVYEMDRHHQKLFDILNRLHDAMKDGKGMQIIAGIVRELLDYTRYHFGEEEKLLEKIGYSGISEQKMAHQKFISQIEGYKEQLSLEEFSDLLVVLLGDVVKAEVKTKYHLNMIEVAAA